MTSHNSAILSRRAFLVGVTAASGLLSAGNAVASPSIIRGAGNVRVLRLDNPRTGDRLSAVYWADGDYIPDVLAEVDFLMRDWRLDLKKKISPATIDIIAATHRLLDTSEPFTLYSGYRSPQTNKMLRRRSRAVARDSYHIKGMAADLHLKGRSVGQIASAARSLGAGGVGRYSRSAFVHVDSGPERQWGR